MMVLGQLISLMEAQLLTNRVTFGFGSPTSLTSYRGYYEQLAIQFEPGTCGPTVEAFLKQLNEANGKVFTGYKGGNYKMSLSTPLWVVGDSSFTSNCTPSNVFSVEEEAIIAVVWCPS